MSNEKKKMTITAETRAYLSKVGKAGMRARWGEEKRPDTATVRVWKDVAARVKASIPVDGRVQWLSETIEAALNARTI